MSGARLPVVRIPPVVPGQGGDEELQPQESVMLELASNSKFNISWPAEQPPQVALSALGAERPVALSSSEGETDVSEDEPNEPVKRHPRPEDFGEDAEFVTPTNNLDLEKNPMDQAGSLPPLPRLSRAFSMPLPAQLSSLQNPRRPSVSSDAPPPPTPEPPELEHFRELSLELADSVQMVIQTLLQLSPPQVLDPAKEQFSACSLSIPTPSISAMFTSMKNLNYMSANMSKLSGESDTGSDTPSSKTSALSNITTDFDVGEMLQSVGDALSGVAAQADVDLVLFHGDVGMKHIPVKGDENGISYTLSHVLRQIVSASHKGDTIEVGLYIDSADLSSPRDGGEDGSPSRLASPTLTDDGLLRCRFRITHRYATDDSSRSSETSSSPPSERPLPSFDTSILCRLLRHVGAHLDTDAAAHGAAPGRFCELSVLLEPGEPSAVNPSVTVSPVDAAILGYPDMHISDEPTLEQLSHFAETLRGKNATLYANSSGSFAHHLSSYLTAWGMDVTHMSTEPGVDGEYGVIGDAASPPPPQQPFADAPPPVETPSTTSPPRKASADTAFMLIDDDVAVLRSRLLKAKAEQVYPLHLHTRKRPSLASNHRPRSSPQVARVIGTTGGNVMPPTPQVVIVHFTSLGKFKLVKDVIQSVLAGNPNGFSSKLPEVIVIPKPAGPRRFLTALHTAVTRPVVDPYFMPTATSPISPGLHAISPFFNMGNIPKSPSGRSTTSNRTSSDRSARSPKDSLELSSGHAPPSPLSQSDNVEYFSDAVMKLGTSPSTGLIIQSPDGQPTGIIFHPKPRSSSNAPPSPQMERDKAQEGREMHPRPGRMYGRVSSGGDGKDGRAASSSSSVPTLRPNPRPTVATSEGSEASFSSKGKARQQAAPVSEEKAPPTIEQSLAVAATPEPPPATSPVAGGPGYLRRRQSNQTATSPPASPQLRGTPGPPGGTARRGGRRPTSELHVSSPTGGAKKKQTPGDNIIPPISVLIVDDNPINQTILTTFMKKKKIKFDVAKNGEEAVHKWRSGTFHLILMDIQMPVMDGIQATKEIRRLEKQNAPGAFPGTPQSEGQRTPSEASTTDSRGVATPPYRSSVIIVALTASSLQADRVAALAAGCNDFLTKPVSLQWLNSKIIEWGSIKALQLWADIRPEVVKSISTGQAAQAQQVARRLHVPEGRSSTPVGDRARSASTMARRAQADSGLEKTATPNTPLADDLSNWPSDASKLAAAANPLSAPIPSMSASEAALSLASAHRPQVSVDDIRASSGLVSPAVPSLKPATPPISAADTRPADIQAPPEEALSKHDEEVAADAASAPPEDEAPPPPPEPEPQ